MVQGIIAGGDVALRRSIEGAEDDAVAGAREVRLQRVGRNDVVVGIAASGTTPFVWGALGEAKKRGATTILICFNPHLNIPRALRPKIVIAPDLGPEVLTGSTRLKCGNATKLILNMLTTLAMVRVGKVMSNLMVDVLPGNAKLRDRATRIVCDLTGDSYTEAKATLETNDWVIRKAFARRGRK
jgi:N-acetylmuramic acid 6-phosphate etherase